MRELELAGSTGSSRIVVGASPGTPADLSLWDISGRRVATLWHGSAPAGASIVWDGRLTGGHAAPTGLYLVRLEDEAGRRVVRRIAVVR